MLLPTHFSCKKITPIKKKKNIPLCKTKRQLTYIYTHTQASMHGTLRTLGKIVGAPYVKKHHTQDATLIFTNTFFFLPERATIVIETPSLIK